MCEMQLPCTFGKVSVSLHSAEQLTSLRSDAEGLREQNQPHLPHIYTTLVQNNFMFFTWTIPEECSQKQYVRLVFLEAILVKRKCPQSTLTFHLSNSHQTCFFFSGIGLGKISTLYWVKKRASVSLQRCHVQLYRTMVRTDLEYCKQLCPCPT